MSVLEPALTRLCAFKKQAQLTPYELETWIAALSIYDARDVNRSVLEIGLSVDPFPDLSKVIAACEKKRRERSGTQTRANDTGRPSARVVEAVARALQLEIE